MLNAYRYPEFPYRQSDEQKRGSVRRHPMVVIGAGPIGLTTALDRSARGLSVVVLDDNKTVGIGSRAVCLPAGQPKRQSCQHAGRLTRWRGRRSLGKDRRAHGVRVYRDRYRPTSIRRH